MIAPKAPDTIVFRCDAGPRLGFGHLTRCRTLALAFRDKGVAPIMVGPLRDYMQPKDATVFAEWVPYGDWASAVDDAVRLCKVANEAGAVWAVLDDYRINQEYQEVLLKRGLRWLQFDGKATHPNWADIVLAPNIARTARDFEGKLRKPGAKLLAGPRYALLRNEFLNPPSRSRNTTVQNVLITFGGGDDRRAVLGVLKALLPATPDEISFQVLLGRHNPSIGAISAWVAANAQNRVELVIDPDAVAPLFAAADLAVMAGGMSTFEAASSGVPMILTSIADNQVSPAAAWDNLGAAVDLGPYSDLADDCLIKVFRDLVNDGEQRYSMACTSQRLVDGQGAERVAEAVLCK